jgi:hypothetical protein
MALGTYGIHIETPVGTSLGDAMGDIRSWLDTHKIEPIAFRSNAIEGVFIFDIRFRSQDEAHLFERDFRLGVSADIIGVLRVPSRSQPLALGEPLSAVSRRRLLRAALTC